MSGEGNGNPLQRSCLEDPRDGGAWWAAVYGVTQSRTRRKRLSSSKYRVQSPLERWPSMISMNRPKMESRPCEFLLHKDLELAYPATSQYERGAGFLFDVSIK